jgi:drug/metabolite transporter (DMT)-like permease
MKSAVLGISAAAVWGSGDFCGGVAAKRVNVFGVGAVSHALGFAIFLLAAVLWGERYEGPRVAYYGLVAGVTGGLALLIFYRALAIGRMSVIAPLSAVLSAVIPALAALLTLGLPKPLQVLGFAMAFGAIALISSTAGGGHGRRGLGLAILSGIGFGIFLVALQRGGSASPLWTMTFARAASMTLIGALAFTTQKNWAPSRRDLGWIFGAGALDAGGNLLFVFATHFGRLDVAAVLASLYPASTVILARVILHERISKLQLTGVATALAAVALISV